MLLPYNPVTIPAPASPPKYHGGADNTLLNLIGICSFNLYSIINANTIFGAIEMCIFIYIDIKILILEDIWLWLQMSLVK